jgi:hypothetical protein
VAVAVTFPFRISRELHTSLSTAPSAGPKFTEIAESEAKASNARLTFEPLRQSKAAVCDPEVARRFCPIRVIETSLFTHENGVLEIVDVSGIETFRRMTLTELPVIWIVLELEEPKMISGDWKGTGA